MKRRTYIISVFALAAAAVCGLTGSSTARADASGCKLGPLSQPFLPWADPGSYGLLPNGGFEQGTSSWSFDGSARVAAGNESFVVSGDNDSRALSLGGSGSATSDDVCVTLGSPTLRLFARNSGSPLSALGVSAQFIDAGGREQTVPIAVIVAGSDWQPTVPIPIDVNLLDLPILSDGSSSVAFTFQPLGFGGDWSIDDVYLDPFKTN